ncbi:cytochrome c-type biogenesis protein CcmH [Myceligenerans salitolerans]|uniref:Cytochrome c-type biogenesis protein n=1 Tax=Myceligenerans salitolerans TaxID=1230528 RepID=A0ABS3I7Q5_9MICO|nr:cytochrome c-type biogenesis protein CcmH [Myceligenerans salitolerans]MBO0609033.1 cytochrome c-type biogenesis protein CcmH [Myceligenerans salitolerans]
MTTPRRPRPAVLLGQLAAMIAVAGLIVALVGAEPATQAQQVREVASTLRCPTCVGEHVADSTSPVAQSMRLVVAEQLQAGRSPDQVRAWFADAYGDDVLLEPPRRGLGWTLWAVPLVVVAAAATAFARRHRGPARRLRRTLGAAAATVGVAALGVWWLAPGLLPGPGGQAGAASTGADTPDGATVVLERAVEDQPGRVELRTALAHRLDDTGQEAAAVPQWAAAVRLRPLDADLRYRYAFALTRTGSTPQAVPILEETLTIDARHAPSLLLLGSVIEKSDPDRSAALLERYRALRADAGEDDR